MKQKYFFQAYYHRFQISDFSFGAEESKIFAVNHSTYCTSRVETCFERQSNKFPYVCRLGFEYAEHGAN